MTAEVDVAHPVSIKMEMQTAAEVEEPEDIPAAVESQVAVKVDVTQPISIRTELPTICTGAKFSSFSEFEAVFEMWKRTNCHAFRVASSETLRQPDGTVYEQFKYRYIVYHCAHYGKPRMRGIGKRPNQNYLPCGCKAMLRLNFNYADNALRITTLNEVHTGHEVSPESFARISAKCRRLSPGSGGSGGASPSPMSGASSWASSKSTNPSPRSAFMPSRAHTHSGSEKTSPASLSDIEKGSLGDNEHVAEYKPPGFNGPPLMQNLKDELLRSYLRMTLGGFGDIASAFQPRGLPSQLPMADQQRLMESQQRYMSSNGIYPNLHSGGARNGLSAAAMGLLELQQRHMNTNSIFPNMHAGNIQAQSPAQNFDAASSMKVLTDLLAMQASRATHIKQEKLSSADAKNPLNELANGLDLSVKASAPAADSLGGIGLEQNARGGASQAKTTIEKWPHVTSALPSTVTALEAQPLKTSNTRAGTTLCEEVTGNEPVTKGVGNLQDFRELISQISKIPSDGTNSELVKYFKRQTQAFMMSKLVKRWGSADIFLTPEFQNFVLSLAPDFQLPSAEELNAVLIKNGS